LSYRDGRIIFVSMEQTVGVDVIIQFGDCCPFYTQSRDICKGCIIAMSIHLIPDFKNIDINKMRFFFVGKYQDENEGKFPFFFCM
jgi:hypothetical protein